MSEKIFSLLSGVIFGIGLVISGMTNPEKVIGFLSITHNWDASLVFVMGGAIAVTTPFFFYILRNRNESLLGFNFNIPQKKNLDNKLLIGSSLFGIGWGLVGLCPGPSISSIAFFEPISLIFLLAMLFGVLISKYI
tara:strand:- start:655 stop:1062 length:408 start_codon:yes stop_codon:yes gene_type:complete